PGANPPPGPSPFVLTTVMGDTLQGAGVRATAASPDGQTILASTGKGLFIWHFLHLGRRPGATLPLIRPVVVPVPEPVYAMAVDPSGRWLATLDPAGVRVWDLHKLLATADGTGRRTQPERPDLTYPVEYAQDLAFHPDGDRIVLAVKNGFKMIDLSGKVLVDLPAAHNSKVETIALGGPGGGLLATADSGGLIRVWRLTKAGQLTL